jgi:hypothetical protein
MTVIAIEHIQLAMPPGREEEARAFYIGLLGIPGGSQAGAPRRPWRGMVRGRRG